MELTHLTFIGIQAALKAGDIIRKGFGSAYQITAKPGRQNIVTEYDKLAEKAIIQLIKDHFPSHNILAEESGLLSEEVNAPLWIIDPLDGTTNFAHHIPLVTVSIAAYQNNMGLCGIIFQPFTNELFVAERNRGAYLNGSKLSVSKTDNLEEAMIAGGFPYTAMENPQPHIQPLVHFIRSGATIRNLGSAALALAYVAAGKIDGFWMDNLFPWDLAAGKLLIEEAGGKVSRYNQEPHDINQPSNTIAANPYLYLDIANCLLKDF